MDKLMKGLGLGDGYIAQGGDIGSFVARVLYTTDESCKAIHSMFSLPCSALISRRTTGHRKGTDQVCDQSILPLVANLRARTRSKP